MSDRESVREGKGFGYRAKDGSVCMIRCFECGRENWAPAVASGRCAWCGHDANKGARDEAVPVVRK